jgi:hypothetical protein
MKPLFLAIGLATTLPILGWQVPARADAGTDAGAEAASDAGMEAAPPMDTGAPKDAAAMSDTAKPDSAPDTGNATPEGGEFGDVIIADGGESADSFVEANPSAMLADAGGEGDTSGAGGGCTSVAPNSDDNLGASVALCLGVISVGWSRRRRATGRPTRPTRKTR